MSDLDKARALLRDLPGNTNEEQIRLLLALILVKLDDRRD